MTTLEISSYRDMNHKYTFSRAFALVFCLTWCGISLSCNEKLPVYVAPTKILSLRVAKVEQLNDRQAPPGYQAVHFQLVGENIFDEVFQDSVDIKGSMRIWWKRKPQRFRTISLTLENFTSRGLIHNGRMLIVP